MTSRLPTPGGDANTWGDILNDFLQQSHNGDGTLIPAAVNTAATAATPADGSVTTAKVADGAITNAKLDTATQTTLAQVASAYVKPASGIPETDLASGVQTSLASADGAAQKSANLSDLADKSAARQNLGVAPAGLPSYAPTTAANPWDASKSVYNVDGASMHTVRAKLAKLAQNTAGIHILHMSDSTGIGFPGSLPIVESKSIPFRMAKALSQLTGNPYITTGLTFAGASANIPADAWTLTGTWSVGSGTILSTVANSTATLTTAQQCTNIEIYYSDASPSFSYTVDGGSSVAVTTTSTSTTKKISLSGLTYGIHTVVITCPTVFTLLTGFRWWTSGLNQIHIHNLSFGGAKANNTGLDASVDWSNKTSTNPVGLGLTATQMISVSGLSFDIAGVCIGSNDMASGNKNAAMIVTGIQNMIGYAPGAAPYLVHEITIGGTDATLAATNGANFFTLADQYDCPMFDWENYVNGLSSYVADGQAGADGLHPIFGHQNLIGTWIAHTLAQRPFYGENNFPGVVGLPDGRYRLIESAGAYPHRPPVPAGGVDYVGADQPTDWMVGDTWDQLSS
jgi:hypothetical protein